MHLPRILVLLVPGLLLAAACSGAASSLVSESSTGSPSSSSSGSGGASDGISSGGASSSGMMSSSGAMSSSSSSGTPVIDAGPPAYTDKNHVFCGTDTANKDVYCATGQVCCGQHLPQDTAFDSFTCAAPGACPRNDSTAAFACDDRNDCPAGQRCCGTGTYINGTMGSRTFFYTGSACQAACGSNVVLCDPTNAGECSNGTCQLSGVLDNGQSTCQQ
jgi:hypothetical protein